MGVHKTTEQSVFDTISDLIAERKKAENEVQRGNKALYELLSKCLKLSLKCHRDIDFGDSINRVCQRRGLKIQTNTPLETKICKLVFGIADDRKKASTYSKVLRIAKSESVPDSALPDWIQKKGGIEKIRLISNPTSQAAYKARRANKLDEEIASLQSMSGIATVEHLPCDSKEGDIVVMLGVVDANNTVKVVEFVDNKNGTLADSLTISSESVDAIPSQSPVLKIGGKTSIHKLAESAQAAA